MKEFSSSPGLHSAPLGPPTGGEKGEPEIKWVSEGNLLLPLNTNHSILLSIIIGIDYLDYVKHLKV